jgi:transposase
MHFVEGVPKKTIARRLGVDVKTVRRVIAGGQVPRPQLREPRGRRLDPWRDQIESWLKAEPKLTAKRIRRLLLPLAGPVPGRTVRTYVSRLRGDLFPREAFVHRTHLPGQTMEVDFGESWAVVAERLHKVKFLVATLPHSNVYFAKAYPVERLECLLDGLEAAFRYFGGVPSRVVLDNTSLAVKRVLPGREREETAAFQGFRGGYPFRADFCAPAKGWEKGSTEGGVKYVRNNAFRPQPRAANWAALNAGLLAELEADLDGRTLPDGRTVRAAWQAEREHLRPLPAQPPATCRVLAAVADKFGQVRVDRSTYSVPIEQAYQPVWVKLFSDRVELAVKGRVVAAHERSFQPGTYVLDPFHVLPLLERKHRAVAEATALQGWKLPVAFRQLREALRQTTRRPDQEWVRVLRLMETHGEVEVEAAVQEALAAGSPRLETVRLLLRQRQEGEAPRLQPAPVCRPELAAVRVAPPILESYDALWRTP